ncbi:3-oxoacyl-ACP synthase [Acanthopleuribacter pedis]|uniref:3-oxoacyl-ACP synthase n=1 Tax=Acanthopleuribacter pedis TaxID=442870 RepID=A0A8J7Q1B8_9BACT|nr:3-oxoacyl-ACP synthase [Acanthopleuribacter pedis]MBO1317300.1 3-oxoacyl-ACP synthase [Acanthopleuribacter pedis]MBO1318607.1 3-oxoacyl-ACP synthase [Acanthopleuribacter pedis]
MDISLARAAVWLPPDREQAADIAAAADLPLEVVREKMGIVRKCRARAEMHPSEMAVRAARLALRDIDPDSIDLLMWTGSEYKDYPVWSAGIYVQEQLGLRRAWAFDMAARCSSNVVGLHIARSMMAADPNINRVLLCGGHRTGDLANYQDPNSRFLYSLADGGAAMVLDREGDNPLRGASVITDGRFSEDVIIPGGGTRKTSRGGLDHADTFLTVPHIGEMRKRLGEVSQPNFVKVIREAAQSRAIDYLALLHIKRSAHDALLQDLELKPSQSIYLDHFGHFGAPDQVLSLGLAEKENLLQPGNLVVLASAGIGYTWSALAFEWNRAVFHGEDTATLI